MLKKKRDGSMNVIDLFKREPVVMVNDQPMQRREVQERPPGEFKRYAGLAERLQRCVIAVQTT